MPADRLLVTVAPTGAETPKEKCPQLPTTPEEIAETAASCEAAGAAMIRLSGWHWETVLAVLGAHAVVVGGIGWFAWLFWAARRPGDGG